jgi:single-stranded-DNA-specific exonuclease
VTEGYGLNKPAIKKIAEAGTKLLITVDNGIRNKAEVEYAISLGMDVVVTDHHLGPDRKEDLPPCLIINPVVKDEEYPACNLAGVGVAYKLVQALVRRSKLDHGTKKKLELRILDLVSVGTVADCVSLSGENRILVKNGLEILNGTNRTGLKELLKSAAVKNGNGLDAWNIGFQIAPRINAAGRLDHALAAFELLTTKDEKRAADLAKILNQQNANRQELTEKIVGEIISGFGESGPRGRIIIAVSRSSAEGPHTWNEGVVGLVAGRIAEKYYLPVIVITESEGFLKGSGRSIPEFNIAKAVEECRDILIKAGGHPAACGFSLKKENMDEFKRRMEAIADRELAGLDLSPVLRIESEIQLADVTEALADQIAMFSPFGLENEQPRLMARSASVVDRLAMGADNQHVKFRLKNGQSGLKSAVGFYQAQKWKDIAIGDSIDIVFHVDINEWNGRREAQMKIVDVRRSG